ncbi:hypothetical protein GCM10009846_19920 [Agrococcus versicolor]|uniref:HNH nuclease domain-containing protein n=1 Tax=Agrococcus versicolor TaxID=501482 RepID=A0ABN3ASW8_9MICO
MRAEQETTETAVVDALVDDSLATSSLLDAEMLAALDELAARRRSIDAAIVEVVGEAAARCERVPVAESLVRAGGHRSLVEAVEHRLGMRRGEARSICEVAEATRARASLTGASIPVARPHVAAALGAATITVSQAEQIVAGLAATGGRVAACDLERAESELVAAATGAGGETPVPPALLRCQVATWVDFLDPDGAEPSEERQRELRSLSFSSRRDGMLVARMLCTPEQGEVLQTALDAHVAPRRVRVDCADDGSEPDGDEAACDGRSIEQRRIDALVSIVASHAATTAPRTGGGAPTLVVTTTLADLEGRAVRPADRAHVQRSGAPATAALVARIVCDGLVHPVLVGDDDGEPLRLGRARRLFSPAQRRAIAARDRGCRAPGCSAPPGWCEAHHVTPWSLDGPTDVDNGMLLCAFHHHEVHREALVIERAPAGSGRRWHVGATSPHRARDGRRRSSPQRRRPAPLSTA